MEEFQVDFYMSSGKVYSIIYTQESIEKVREIVDNLIEFSSNITHAEEGDRIPAEKTPADYGIRIRLVQRKAIETGVLPPDIPSIVKKDG